MSTMDHATAVSTNAVERYLLKELSTSERDAFEEHLFDCSVCAEDVKATAAFLDNCQSVVQESDDASMSAVSPAYERANADRRGGHGWRRPQYALAASLVAMMGTTSLTIYQNRVTIPQLHEAVAASARGEVIVMLAGEPLRSTRGPRDTITVSPTERFSLSFDIPPNAGVEVIQIEVVSSTNESMFSKDLAVPPGNTSSAFLSIPPLLLRPGSYTLRVRSRTPPSGAGGPDLATFHFDLQFSS